MKKLLFIIIFLAIFLGFFTMGEAKADTLILRPNAPGDACNFKTETGDVCPNHYLNVDEAVSDDGSTANRISGEYGNPYYRDIFHLDDSAGAGTINSVTVYIRVQQQYYNIYAYINIKPSDTVYQSNQITIPTGRLIGYPYTLYSNTWVANPDTNAAWTWSEINNLQAGSYQNAWWQSSVNFGEARTTQVYVVVDYTPLPYQSHNVSGYAWSENIGWISFNCTNEDSCGTIDYGVNIETNSKLSGHAWSENIGWIDFAPLGPYPALPNYSAKIVSNNQISGWARALSYGGGWDGWIKMAGDDYGVSIDNSNGEFSGYAWSDMVIGWIKFNGVGYRVITTFISNSPPDKPIIPAENPTWASECIYDKALPTFTWEYIDEDNFPLGKDPQTAYQIRIDNDQFFDTNFDGSAILGEDEFVCDDNVCSGAGSVSFSPGAGDWMDWSDYDETYYWIVRVKDSHGSWSVWSDITSFETQLHTYPEPNFIHTPESPVEEEEVIFTDLSTCYNFSNEPYYCRNGANRYVWTFGDEETCDSNVDVSCRGDVTHSYSGVSEYTVTLQVTDNVGACSTQGDTPINTSIPLPEYKEIPPVFFINKFLAEIANYFKNLAFF